MGHKPFHELRRSFHFARKTVPLSCSRAQIDSRTKRLEGTRKGDRFTGVDGVVLQADENAALNILDRFYDTQISRYATKEEVKRILLGRLSGATEHQ